MKTFWKHFDLCSNSSLFWHKKTGNSVLDNHSNFYMNMLFLITCFTYQIPILQREVSADLDLNAVLFFILSFHCWGRGVAVYVCHSISWSIGYWIPIRIRSFKESPYYTVRNKTFFFKPWCRTEYLCHTPVDDLVSGILFSWSLSNATAVLPSGLTITCIQQWPLTLTFTLMPLLFRRVLSQH